MFLSVTLELAVILVQPLWENLIRPWKRISETFHKLVVPLSHKTNTCFLKYRDLNWFFPPRSLVTYWTVKKCACVLIVEDDVVYVCFIVLAAGCFVCDEQAMCGFVFKEARKGFSLLYCLWNDGRLQRRMFNGVNKLYVSLQLCCWAIL